MSGIERDWSSLITAREVELPNKVIEDGLKFLDLSHTRQGWGTFLGMEFDRRSSAVAMEALQIARAKADTTSMLTPTVESFVRKYEGQYPGLGIDAVTDVIYLLGPALLSGSQERKAVLQRANEVLADLLKNFHADAPRRISALHLAVEGIEPFGNGKRDSICDFLLASQQSANGSWSPTQGAEPSLASTAEAVRALAKFDREDAAKSVRFASSFLTAESRKILERQESADTFDLTVSLRALAEIEDVDYELISRLESELMRRRNEDGGWASSVGRDSSVELTGLAVLALVGAGAFRHVPARLARAIISNVGKTLDEVSGDAANEPTLKERAEVAERTEEALDAAYEKIQKQAKIIANLELQAKLAQRLAGPAFSERELLVQDSLRGVRIFVSLAFAVLAVGAIMILVGIGGSSGVGGIAAVSIGAATAFLAAAFFFGRQRLSARKALASVRDSLVGHDGANLAVLRRSLQEIILDWPPPARDELPYLLFDRFLDAPSDVAARRAERVAINLGIRGQGVERFTSWASAVGLLSETERRVLFEQLRHQLL